MRRDIRSRFSEIFVATAVLAALTLAALVAPPADAQRKKVLSIAAKVQGEPDTVVGKIIFHASR